MTRLLNLRATDEDLALLASLRRPGETVSDVLRRGLRAAQILERRELMREESRVVAADPADRAESQTVQAELAALRAW